MVMSHLKIQYYWDVPLSRTSSLFSILFILSLLHVLLLQMTQIHSSPVEFDRSNSDSQLQYVIVIHRHGDRSPLGTYPNDPYKNPSYWPDGVGQLTKKGKQRMYGVGRYMRRRYAGFLGASPREATIRSSGSDRCLESTSLLLAGLYKPQGRWQWNQDLGTLWQPFPIHTVPHDRDSMLNPDSQCPRAKEEIDRIYASETVQDYAHSMKSTIKYVEMNSGLKNMDLIAAEEMFDTILIQKLNNLDLPAWIDTQIFEKLYEIMNRTFVFSAMTRKIQKFRAGVLLKHIVENIEHKHDKKLFVYSTHDTQLSVFLSALNVYDGQAPPFGATIFIEVHRKSGQKFLKFFYLKDTKSEVPEELVLRDCQEDPSVQPLSERQQFKRENNDEALGCSYKSFRRFVHDLLPEDWETECGNKNINENSPSFVEPDVLSIYISSITLMIAMMILFIFLYLFLKNRRNMIVYKMLPIN